MARTTLNLTIEETYPTDEDPCPVRIHGDHLVELDAPPGSPVQLVTENSISATFECQRNDYIPSEKGLIRVSPTIREELGVSLGDTVTVSAG